MYGSAVDGAARLPPDLSCLFYPTISFVGLRWNHFLIPVHDAVVPPAVIRDATLLVQVIKVALLFVSCVNHQLVGGPAKDMMLSGC